MADASEPTSAELPPLFAQKILAGRVAIITGGGTGIGLAIARRLGSLGATLVFGSRNSRHLEDGSAELRRAGFDSLACQVDVRKPEQVDEMVHRAIHHYGRIDILINNAAGNFICRAEDLSPNGWNAVIGSVLNGSFYCSRAVGRHMVAARRGAIVNLSSIMGLCGGGLYPNPAYHAAKGALVNFTRALALEWAPHGVRVNAVAPAFTRTALVEKLLSDNALADAIIAATPLGRLVEPEEVAAAILFLASDAAAMITGHTLPVDGGWLAR